ncbi:glycosyltransferase family A protein [Rhizobium sp. S152]|uniref:glycosyltransferase n=1 Tax=Rhizobium sp. S152 TaxID=3055038 RepID=UPI0025A9E2CF|nr:glycosyltransferase family A protein [Rhizobium sp. S152]MDM9627919.1 glycosyltransferase family A protein [Rhizobium sp. S152]
MILFWPSVHSLKKAGAVSKDEVAVVRRWYSTIKARRSAPSGKVASDQLGEIIAPDVEAPGEVGVVVIGRNEGQRLVDCLQSLRPFIHRTVYVDSGSTDDSVAMAARAGAKVVALDMSIPFTAARARNEGVAAAIEAWPDICFVQFVDGDCLVDENWIVTGVAFLAANRNASVVSGHLRERFPERSVFNALNDNDWQGGVAGQTTICGGNSLMRVQPFQHCGGYRSSLIAGEEPELCVRLRQAGGTVWQLDADMVRHDSNMMHFGQWWRRCVRTGYAFAEVSYIHRGSALSPWRRSIIRSIFWAFALPLLAISGALFVHPALALLFALYPFQLVRLALRGGISKRLAWQSSIFDLIGKFAEFRGIVKFCVNHIRKRNQKLIEYK